MLNDNGFETKSHCCGHGGPRSSILLKDGRAIIFVNSDDEIFPFWSKKKELERQGKKT
jgi:ribosomal protein L24E